MASSSGQIGTCFRDCIGTSALKRNCGDTPAVGETITSPAAASNVPDATPIANNTRQRRAFMRGTAIQQRGSRWSARDSDWRSDVMPLPVSNVCMS
jgi:hypothetical protein